MNFKTAEFDGVKYVAPSWQEMGELVFELFKKIEVSGKKFDRVVALAKGGWTWARTLVDYLKIEELDSVRIKFYFGIEEKVNDPKIVVPLSVKVGGENVLVFDDVADSGKTLRVAKEHLLDEGAKEVEFATLFYKSESEIEPEFWGYKTDAWIVFPHEIREFIDETQKKWSEKGLAKGEIVNRYKSLGLSDKQIEYFVGKNGND